MELASRTETPSGPWEIKKSTDVILQERFLAMTFARETGLTAVISCVCQLAEDSFLPCMPVISEPMSQV